MPLVCLWEQAVLLCYRRSARIGRRSAARCGLRRRRQSLDVARTSSYEARSAGLMRISSTGSPQVAGEEWYFMAHSASAPLGVLGFSLFRPWRFLLPGRKASPRPVGLSPGGRGGGWGYQHHSAPDSGAESEFSGPQSESKPRSKQQVFSGVDTDTGQRVAK